MLLIEPYFKILSVYCILVLGFVVFVLCWGLLDYIIQTNIMAKLLIYYAPDNIVLKGESMINFPKSIVN